MFDLPENPLDRLAFLEREIARLSALVEQTSKRSAEQSHPYRVRLVRTAERSDSTYAALDEYEMPVVFLQGELSGGEIVYTERQNAPAVEAFSRWWLPPGVDVEARQDRDERWWLLMPPAIPGKIVADVDAACWQASGPYVNPDDPTCLTPGSSNVAFQVYKPAAGGAFCPQKYSDNNPVYLPIKNIVGEITEGASALATPTTAGWVATVASCVDLETCGA